MGSALTYAAIPLPRRWPRVRKWLVRIALAVTIVLAAKIIYTRACLLERNPCVGPVAWRQVLTSPTALKTAWTLSGNPLMARDPAVFGLEPGKLVLTIDHPLSFDNGQVQIDLTVRNTGSKTVVLPALTTVGDICYPTGCLQGNLYALGNSPLTMGFRLLPPGKSTTIPLHFPATQTPDQGNLMIELFDCHWIFWIDAGSGWRTGNSYKNWSEVPLSKIIRDRRDHPY